MLAYRDGPPDIFESESEIFDEESRSEHSFAHLYSPFISDDPHDPEHQRVKEMLWEKLRKI